MSEFLDHRAAYEQGLKDRIKELEKDKAELIKWLDQTHEFRDDVLIRTVLNRIKRGAE